MKKILYIAPSMTVTEIELTAIVATSSNGVTSDGNVAIPGVAGTGNGEDAAVKHSSYDVWDDDWSE